MTSPSSPPIEYMPSTQDLLRVSSLPLVSTSAGIQESIISPNPDRGSPLVVSSKIPQFCPTDLKYYPSRSKRRSNFWQSVFSPPSLIRESPNFIESQIPGASMTSVGSFEKTPKPTPLFGFNILSLETCEISSPLPIMMDPLFNSQPISSLELQVMIPESKIISLNQESMTSTMY